MSDSTYRDRGVPPATSKKPITLEVHLEPKGNNDWSLTVTSSVGTENSARLLHSVADMMPYLESKEDVESTEKMKPVVIMRQTNPLPGRSAPVEVHAKVTPVKNNEIEICLISNISAEQTKQLLTHMHNPAMQEIP